MECSLAPLSENLRGCILASYEEESKKIALLHFRELISEDQFFFTVVLYSAVVWRAAGNA